MKISIPKPCLEKLSNDNFCQKCQHHIQDLSNLNSNDLENSIKSSQPNCAIFSTKQLENHFNYKPIFNAIVIGALGLIPIQSIGQDVVKKYINTSNNFKKLQKHKFKFMLEENDSTKIKADENFRLLINEQLILESFDINKEYAIEFEAEENSEIIIRIASNNGKYEIEKLLLSYHFPEVINIKRSELSFKSIIMGKIVYKPKNKFE